VIGAVTTTSQFYSLCCTLTSAELSCHIKLKSTTLQSVLGLMAPFFTAILRLAVLCASLSSSVGSDDMVNWEESGLVVLANKLLSTGDGACNLHVLDQIIAGITGGTGTLHIKLGISGEKTFAGSTYFVNLTDVTVNGLDTITTATLLQPVNETDLKNHLEITSAVLKLNGNAVHTTVLGAVVTEDFQLKVRHCTNCNPKDQRIPRFLLSPPSPVPPFSSQPTDHNGQRHFGLAAASCRLVLSVGGAALGPDHGLPHALPVFSRARNGCLSALASRRVFLQVQGHGDVAGAVGLGVPLQQSGPD
jgi:hypothetical protein